MPPDTGAERVPGELAGQSAQDGGTSKNAAGKRPLTRFFKSVKAVCAAAATLATIATGIIALVQLRPSPHPHHGPPPRPVSSLDRTPVLGIQFRQDRAIVPMSSRPDGSSDIVTVHLARQPFTMYFPALPAGYSLGINARLTGDGFNLRAGEKIGDVPDFQPGTGMANYQYGDGTLFLNPQAQNYFIGDRIEHGPAGTQFIYISSFGQQTGDVSVTRQRSPVYLAVLRGTQANSRDDNSAIVFGSYEYFVLTFG